MAKHFGGDKLGQNTLNQNKYEIQIFDNTLSSITLFLSLDKLSRVQTRYCFLGRRRETPILSNAAYNNTNKFASLSPSRLCMDTSESLFLE